MKTSLLFALGALLVIFALLVFSKRTSFRNFDPIDAPPVNKTSNTLPTAPTATAFAFDPAFATPRNAAAILNLNTSEIAALNHLFRATRELVLRRLATEGKIEVVDKHVVRLTVELSVNASDKMRKELYERMAEIIGPDRLHEFSKIANIARFESSFEFFGEFPLAYQFVAKGGSFAEAAIIETRTMVAKKDPFGSYDAFWEGTYPRRDFEKSFSPVAEAVLNAASHVRD